MLSTIKKFTAISILILVLLSGLAGASNVFNFKSLNYDSASTKTITLYRYGPDGSVNPVEIDIDLKDGINLEDAITEKCSELIDNDIGLLDYINGNNTVNITVFSKIKSTGIGHHWRSPFSVRIPYPLLLKYRIFLRLPIIYKMLGIYASPVVVCNYSNDETASTNIELVYMPYRPSNTTIKIEGKQTVWVFGFVGYIGWLGVNAKFIDDRGKSTLFYGYASAIYCKQFP